MNAYESRNVYWEKVIRKGNKMSKYDSLWKWISEKRNLIYLDDYEKAKE